MVPRTALVLALALLAGCGSASREALPPAAEPASSPALAAAPAGRVVPVGAEPEGVVADARSVSFADGGRSVAVVAARERVVELFDVASGRRIGRADAGVGPTHVVSDGGDYLFVTDTAGGALLVFHLRPRLEPIRRYPLPGSPYGIAIDNRRHLLYVTQTARNELTELTAEGRPHLVARYATPRQANAVAVDAASGRVFVAGKADGVLQLLDPAPR